MGLFMKFSDLNLLSVGNTIQLVGAVYAGEGNTYVMLLPEEDAPGSINVLSMSPDDWKACLNQSDLSEVEYNDGVRKAIVRKCERQVDTTLAWSVFRRDDFRCRYCGSLTKPLTVDHLIVWEAGGPTILENLVSSCKRCNRTRGNKSYADWLNSNDYSVLSKDLSPEVAQANLDLLSTLDKIKRVNNIRSR